MGRGIVSQTGLLQLRTPLCVFGFPGLQLDHPYSRSLPGWTTFSKVNHRRDQPSRIDIILLLLVRQWDLTSQPSSFKDIFDIRIGVHNLSSNSTEFLRSHSYSIAEFSLVCPSSSPVWKRRQRTDFLCSIPSIRHWRMKLPLSKMILQSFDWLNESRDRRKQIGSVYLAQPTSTIKILWKWFPTIIKKMNPFKNKWMYVCWTTDRVKANVNDNWLILLKTLSVLWVHPLRASWAW